VRENRCFYSSKNIIYWYKRGEISFINENYITIDRIPGEFSITENITIEAQTFIKNTLEYKKLVISRILKEKLSGNTRT
jgi:hypothetical protein